MWFSLVFVLIQNFITVCSALCYEMDLMVCLWHVAHLCLWGNRKISSSLWKWTWHCFFPVRWLLVSHKNEFLFFVKSITPESIASFACLQAFKSADNIMTLCLTKALCMVKPLSCCCVKSSVSEAIYSICWLFAIFCVCGIVEVVGNRTN